jgi:hypothetical protein
MDDWNSLARFAVSLEKVLNRIEDLLTFVSTGSLSSSTILSVFLDLCRFTFSSGSLITCWFFQRKKHQIPLTFRLVLLPQLKQRLSEIVHISRGKLKFLKLANNSIQQLSSQFNHISTPLPPKNSHAVDKFSSFRQQIPSQPTRLPQKLNKSSLVSLINRIHYDDTKTTSAKKQLRLHKDTKSHSVNLPN